MTTQQKNEEPISAPPLFGLVLSGGLSTRMGKDKGSLIYGNSTPGITARERCFHLLTPHCDSVFISCRRAQEELVPLELPRIYDGEDSFEINRGEVHRNSPSLGPASGILAAFRHSGPNVAWLVLACDMPEVDDEAIQTLIRNRNLAKPATAYVDPDSDLPEPLFAIWEPSALTALEVHFQQGLRSPRKTLETVGFQPIVPKRSELLVNVNTWKEYQRRSL